MGTGLYALWYISTRFDMLIRMNSSDRSLYDPIGILSWMESPMEPLTFCILLVTCIGLNMLYILGWRFRVTGPAFAIVALWVLTYRNSWSMIYHSQNVLILQICVVAFSGAADAWSLDVIRSRAHGRGERLPSLRYGWPVFFIILLTTLTYFLSGVAKWAGGAGWAWMSGEVMRSQVVADALRKDVLGIPPQSTFLALYDQLLLFTAMGVFTVIVETGAPLAAFRRSWGKVWAPISWMMHLGIFLIMGIRFRFQLSGLQYLGFLDIERPFALRSVGLALPNGHQRDRRPILFFDGECTLCNKTVQWLLAHERHDALLFASLNSETARDQLAGTPHAGHGDSILLLEPDGSVFVASDAAFRLVRHLTPRWQLVSILMAFPRLVREPVYRFVALNRKRWFGTTAHCALLSEIDQGRLLS